jgi:hypothetical protein
MAGAFNCLRLWASASWMVAMWAWGGDLAAQTAPPSSGTCASMPLEEIVKSTNVGYVFAQPATAVLPARGDARIVYNKPLDIAQPQRFRVFNVTGSGDLSAVSIRKIRERLPSNSDPSVVSVEQIPDKLIRRYPRTDNVLLRLNIDDRFSAPWTPHEFIIVECTAKGQFSSWARVDAQVSAPYVTLFCIPVAAICFALAIWAVYKSREETAAGLIEKYPSVFKAKKFDRIDFINPIQLAANAFNQGSVQKLQVLMFSFLIGWLVLSLVLRTGTLSDMSVSVVALLGISAIGAAVSQITYTSKTRLSCKNWSWLQSNHALKAQPARSPQWKDLVLTNREFDVYKLQAIIFSLAVAAALIAAGGSNLSTFEIPDTMLGVLGLSQVVFVGGILVRPPATDDLDKMLDNLRDAAEKWSQAIVQGMDVDKDGTVVPTLPGQLPAINATRRYADLVDQAIPMIESTLEVEVERNNLLHPRTSASRLAETSVDPITVGERPITESV